MTINTETSWSWLVFYRLTIKFDRKYMHFRAFLWAICGACCPDKSYQLRMFSSIGRFLSIVQLSRKQFDIADNVCKQIFCIYLKINT